MEDRNWALGSPANLGLAEGHFWQALNLPFPKTATCIPYMKVVKQGKILKDALSAMPTIDEHWAVFRGDSCDKGPILQYLSKSIEEKGKA